MEAGATAPAEGSPRSSDPARVRTVGESHMGAQSVIPARRWEGSGGPLIRGYFSWLLAACCMVLAGAPSLAAKPPPQGSATGASPVRKLDLEGAPLTGPPCTIGEVGPPVFSVDYLYPPDDAYYVLLTAGACGSCLAPDTTIVSTAHVVLHFPTACSQPVSISVVGTTGGPSCRVPDPTNVLCPPSPYDLAPGAAGTYDFALPFSAPCHLDADAFLCVNFVSDGVGCAAARPRLMTTAQCANCQNYNIYPAGNDDLCAVNFPGALVMYVDALSCAVPNLARSWGAVKIHYR